MVVALVLPTPRNQTFAAVAEWKAAVFQALQAAPVPRLGPRQSVQGVTTACQLRLLQRTA